MNAEVVLMRILNLILTIILIISLPVSAICLSNSLTSAMPDLYQYELKSTEALGDIYIEKTEDEVGQIFSDFMMGKTEKFQIQYQFGDNIDNLFTYDEQKTMDKFRDVNRLTFFIGLDTLLICLLSYVLLYKQNLKPLLRRTFMKAAIVFAVLAGVLFISTFIAPVMDLRYEYLFDYELKPFLILPKLISKAFFVHGTQATVVIATVVMIVVWYFTWKMTKPRRIFGALR